MVLFGRLDDPLQLFGSLGPYERPRIFVVVSDIVQEEFLELAFGSMNTLGECLLTQDAEKAFHHIDPRSVGRRVMEMHPGMPFQPVSCRLVLVDVEIV